MVSIIANVVKNADPQPGEIRSVATHVQPDTKKAPANYMQVPFFIGVPETMNPITGKYI